MGKCLDIFNELRKNRAKDNVKFYGQQQGGYWTQCKYMLCDNVHVPYLYQLKYY